MLEHCFACQHESVNTGSAQQGGMTGHSGSVRTARAPQLPETPQDASLSNVSTRTMIQAAHSEAAEPLWSPVALQAAAFHRENSAELLLHFSTTALHVADALQLSQQLSGNGLSTPGGRRGGLGGGK